MFSTLDPLPLHLDLDATRALQLDPIQLP